MRKKNLHQSTILSLKKKNEKKSSKGVDTGMKEKSVIWIKSKNLQRAPSQLDRATVFAELEATSQIYS